MSVITEAYESLKGYPVNESGIKVTDFKKAQNEVSGAIRKLGPAFKFRPAKITLLSTGALIGEISVSRGGLVGNVVTIQDQMAVDEALEKLSAKSKEFEYKRGQSFGDKMITGMMFGYIGAMVTDNCVYAKYKQ